MRSKGAPAGFTVVELIIVIAVISVMAAAAVPSFVGWLREQQASGAAQQLLSVLQLAQNETLASQSDSQYGVYIDSANSRYVLFKGSSYAARDASADQSHALDASVAFGTVSLTGGASEVTFEKFSGLADESGSIQLVSAADASVQKTVYVAPSGAASLAAFSTPSDAGRVTDSRHVLVDYSRAIDTANETITLTFNGTVPQQIPIAANMNGGELDWQGTVSVGGVGQTVEIATMRLNNPDTQFDIHRPRDENTVSLQVSISGDTTGDVIDYSADGTSTTAGSMYASNIAWQ